MVASRLLLSSKLADSKQIEFQNFVTSSDNAIVSQHRFCLELVCIFSSSEFQRGISKCHAKIFAVRIMRF